MTEAEFLAALRRLPLHPGARGLADDAAVVGGLVLTADTLVEGVHFLAADPPGDVAWKLVATNLSDLAAKGARPEGVLLGYPLSEPGWDAAFLAGLSEALAAFECPLVGGDTVSLPPGAPRVLSLTAIGVDAAAPARSGARAGDGLWVTGTVGDSGAGLAIALDEAFPGAGRGPVANSPKLDPGLRRGTAEELLMAYRRPAPRLVEGRALAPLVHAMMDVSDGVLIDASRMAAASGLAVTVDLALLPLSPALIAHAGADRAARLAAATAGDDYELLFAAPADLALPVPGTRIGRFAIGVGLALVDGGEPVPLPSSLGYEHRG